MSDPMGYFSLLSQFWGYSALVALLALFYFERASYGRQSLEGLAFSRLIAYYVLTIGTSGIYWRLKATVALNARDRLPSLIWIALLVILFLLVISPYNIFWGVIIWDFWIRHKWWKATSQDLSWIFTLFFGHLYLASSMNGQTHRLPFDFRQENPAKRQRLRNRFGIMWAFLLVLVVAFYGTIYGQRSREFHRLRSETPAAEGYWHAKNDKQEYIYRMDKEGTMWVNVIIRSPDKRRLTLQMKYAQSTKNLGGQRYAYRWFDCLQVDDRAALDRIERPIGAEEYRELKNTYEGFTEFPVGWQLGEFVRSPWHCELDSVKNAGPILSY